jgi:hypothetical protein
MRPAHRKEPVIPFLYRIGKQPLRNRSVAVLSILGPCLLFSACASVDTILLTSETFPPKKSADDVAVLEQKPARPYLELAELRIGDSWLSFGSLQRKILHQAATLGADAVVFTHPETQTTRQVAYEPVYDPWGYNSPYYGPGWGYGGYGGPYGGWGLWGGGYAGMLAVPVDQTIRLLMGTAIHYTDATGLENSKRPNKNWLQKERGNDLHGTSVSHAQ